MTRKTKTIAQLKKDLDKVFSAFIRQRDCIGETFACISCGQTKPKAQMHAGHFFPRTHAAVRWNEDNVHGQCIACNTYLHGNLYQYSIRLQDKIGLVRFGTLEMRKHLPDIIDRQWLEERIEHYKQKTK